MRSLPAWSLATMMLFACAPSEPELGHLSQPVNGQPVNGFPNYAERLMLVAINRARSDPNNHALGTAGGTKCPSACATNGTKSPTCWDTFPAQKPWMYSYAASRASRFHCQNLHQMHFGLSHPSPCTLRTDVDTTACDGAQACACSANPHPNDCGSSTTPPWQGGTTPYVRVGYFGFTPSSYGEVGAAGYTDGWTAVAGWMDECADYQGHRQNLTSATYDQTGCGFAAASGTCWSTFFFCDQGSGGPATATLPAGVHSPETGGASTSFAFYVNYYSTSGAPQSMQLVLDGTCYPMTREIGAATNGTFKVSRALGDTACHRYWFLAKDGAGTRATWPEAGAWGVGGCTDYLSTAPPAACEACVQNAVCTTPDGCQIGKIDCGTGSPVCGNYANAPDGTACATGQCLSGACRPPPGLDAGSAGLDASAPGRDAASPGLDAATAPGPDAAATPGADAASLPGLDAAAIPGADAASLPGLDAATAPRPDAAGLGPDAAVAVVSDAASADFDSGTVASSDAAIALADGATDPWGTVQPGCGCASAHSSAAWFGLASLVVLCRRRGRP